MGEKDERYKKSSQLVSMEYRIFGTQLTGQKFQFPLEEETHYTRLILNKKGNNNPEIFKFFRIQMTA